MVSPELQLFAFLVIVLLGMVSGFLFDLQRAWRRLAQPGKWSRDIGDLLFVLVIGILIVPGLLLINWGELRGFVFLALLGGIGLYFHLASPLVLRLITRLFARAWRASCIVSATARVSAKRFSQVASRRTREVVRPVREPYMRARGWARYTVRRLKSFWKKIDGFL